MNKERSIDPVEIVLRLLSAAVNDSGRVQLPAMDESEWNQVLGICAAQNIHTLVVDYLPDNLPESLAARLHSLSEAVERQNGVISSVTTLQEGKWRSLGLDYALLKGAGLSPLYAHPEHRGCGDIDWYFADARSFDEAMEVAARNAADGIHFDSDGDFNYKFGGVIIEHHRDWTHLASARNRRIIGRPSATDGRISPEDTIFLLETHILHHLAYRGMGLKQFADLAAALIYYDGKYSRDSFAARMESVSLTAWSGILHSFLSGYLNVGREYLPIAPEATEWEMNTLMSAIFEGGCVPQCGRPSFRNLVRNSYLLLKLSRREWFSRYSRLTVGRILRNSKK